MRIFSTTALTQNTTHNLGIPAHGNCEEARITPSSDPAPLVFAGVKGIRSTNNPTAAHDPPVVLHPLLLNRTMHLSCSSTCQAFAMAVKMASP